MMKHACMNCGTDLMVDIPSLLCKRCLQAMKAGNNPSVEIQKPIIYFDYGTALTFLKHGKKVSAIRWNDNVYVQLEDVGFKTLVLTDENRNKKVNFTPSVENQFEDEWFVVE